MGCFSFMCKECGQSIKSNSFNGEPVKLFLLKDGKVIEQLEGLYDSYGRVFNEDASDCVPWSMPWDQVCDLMFSGNAGDGIAAVHEVCWRGVIPTTQSDDDPNQGWGSDDSTEDEWDEEEM